MNKTISLLTSKNQAGKFICVGLDTNFADIPNYLQKNKIPRVALTLFNRQIIDKTHDIACAFKINSAFYEAAEMRGHHGMQVLEETIAYIKDETNTPVILDYKRADIGNTNNGYAEFAFGHRLDTDAITVNPYLGSIAMKPFLDYKDKVIIVLCRTSNEGAGEELQDQYLQTNLGSVRVFEHIAMNVRDKWNYNDNCMLVVGATAPEQLQAVRKIVPTMPILVPGVGKQGGKLEEVLANGLTKNRDGLIINSSRDVIYASSEMNFANTARNIVFEMNRKVEMFLSNLK